MDTCTVAVLDAITAFAVPNPGVSSQIRRFFRVWPRASRPAPESPSLLRTGNDLLKPTLSAVDSSKISHFSKDVNARFWCNWRICGGIGKAPDVPPVKTFHGSGECSLPERLGLPVEILHALNTENHERFLTWRITFTHGAVRMVQSGSEK